VPQVRVPAARVERWVENVERRHGATTLSVRDGALHGRAADGTVFAARLPFGTAYDGPVDPAAFAAALSPPGDWGVLLVRKGGFAVARLSGPDLVEHKIGQRHVQGRTKAGGQSQQRFARRRDNQARQAFEAAADHAARLLAGLGPVVVGGDRSAAEQVLTDPRLAGLAVVGPWLDVPDPRRRVLDAAVLDAMSAEIEIDEPELSPNVPGAAPAR
jgi:Actinobacteria/chloroflexi VLRF1 release factor